MSRINPLELPEPANLSLATKAREHAQSQLVLIDKRIEDLKRSRELWKIRLGLCVKVLNSFSVVETVK